MDWSNERYVRLYTRDTDDWLCLSWQARSLLMEIFRKVDRAGVLETRRGARGVAALCRFPVEVVDACLSELLDGPGAPLKAHARGFVVVNFIPAQEAAQSDPQRQRDSRERRAAIARFQTELQPGDTDHKQLASGDGENSRVTFRDEPPGGSSQSVTTRHSDPSETDQISESQPARARAIPGAGVAEVVPEHQFRSPVPLPASGAPVPEPGTATGVRNTSSGDISGARADAASDNMTRGDLSRRPTGMAQVEIDEWQAERSKRRSQILRAIIPLHVEIFNRVRVELDSSARPMHPMGDPVERALRALLESLPSYDDVEDNCRHVLEVRQAEAKRLRSVQYLGSAVWHPVAYARALEMTLDEAKSEPPRRGPRPGVGYADPETGHVTTDQLQDFGG